MTALKEMLEGVRAEFGRDSHESLIAFHLAEGELIDPDPRVRVSMTAIMPHLPGNKYRMRRALHRIADAGLLRRVVVSGKTFYHLPREEDR